MFYGSFISFYTQKNVSRLQQQQQQVCEPKSLKCCPSFQKTSEQILHKCFALFLIRHSEIGEVEEVSTTRSAIWKSYEDISQEFRTHRNLTEKFWSDNSTGGSLKFWQYQSASVRNSAKKRNIGSNVQCTKLICYMIECCTKPWISISFQQSNPFSSDQLTCK